MGGGIGGSQSTGGKAAQTIFDPAGTVINAFSDATGLSKIEPVNSLQQLYQAPIDNTMNYVEGREQFGQHKDFFGASTLGDTLNPMVGGRTREQQAQWDDYYNQTGAYAPRERAGGKKKQSPKNKDKYKPRGTVLVPEDKQDDSTLLQ